MASKRLDDRSRPAATMDAADKSLDSKAGQQQMPSAGGSSSSAEEHNASHKELKSLGEDGGAAKSSAASHDASPSSTSPTTAAEKPSLWSRLPDWVQSGLTDKRSLRMLIRCWAASWAAFILILPGPSLRVLGQAAFFASLSTFILPANMPVVLFSLASVFLVAGASLGWAWGCAALASAVRARDRTLLASQVRRVNAEAMSATNPDQYFELAIFRGEFLDSRSSAVVGVYFVLGTYASAWLQAKRPKLKIAGVFASILLDVNATTGPLFPFGQYTLGNILFRPLLCAVAISLACNFLFFPESMAHIWHDNLVKLLDLSDKVLHIHYNALQHLAKDPRAGVDPQTSATVGKLHAGLVGLADVMQGQLGLLSLDVSYGKVSPRDLRAIFASFRTTGVQMFGLDAFFNSYNDMRLFRADEKEGQSDETDDMVPKGAPVTLDQTQLLLHFRQRIDEVEAEHNVQIQHLLTLLSDATQKPLKAAQESTETVSGWLRELSKYRGKYDHAAWVEKLQSSYDALSSALQAFVDEDRMAIVEPYEHLFLEDSHGAKTLSGEAQDTFRESARPLYLCYVFCGNLANYLEALKETHALVIKIAERRSKSRLWFPKLGIGKLIKYINSHSAGIDSDAQLEQQSPLPSDRYTTTGPDPLASDEHESETSTLNDENSHGAHDIEKGATPSQPAVSPSNEGVATPSSKTNVREKHADADKAEKEKRARHTQFARDPDALPPTNAIHYFGRFLGSIHKAFWSPAGVYALRYAIASFVVWVVSVVPSSAHFFYRNRGLWALIMAQTGMALSGGELIFSLITRLIGTGLGLVFGMLYWYMSCGQAARGNAYGLAAVTAIGFIPLVWVRINAPIQFIFVSIMFGVTAELVLGYSWIDTHLIVEATAGKGVEVGWRRALLVVIGMAVAFLVTLFPQPPSTRRRVRIGFAKNTELIAKLYASVIEGWIVVEELDKTTVGPHHDHSPATPDAGRDAALLRQEKQRTDEVLAALRPRFLASQAVLGMLARDINLATLDIDMQGPWPKARYLELYGVQRRMLQSISQLGTALSGLDATWRRRMLYTTAILDPFIISDISISLSLLSTSLHTGTPLPHAMPPLLETALQHQALSRAVERSLARQDTSHNDSSALTLAMLRDPQLMQQTTGVMALIAFVRQLDKFRLIVRELVGEQELAGYDAIKARFDQRLLAAKILRGS